jgi:hypothetical protein
MGIIKKTTLLIFLALFCELPFAQNYKVGFAVRFQPKIGDTATITERYNLQINTQKGESFFNFEEPYGEFNGSIFKNYKTNNIVKFEIIQHRDYKQNLISNFKWKLSLDKKEILGILCNSATLNFGDRQWKAWYTTSLPIQDGPYKFCGLPGLILEIGSDDAEYRFKATSIEKNNIEINLPEATPFGTIANEIKFKENLIKDPSMLVYAREKQTGLSSSASFNGAAIVTSGAEFNHKFWDWMKAHSNPIEKGTIRIK